MVAVDDCGVVVNPLLAEGQVHGGLAQGVAQILFEAVEYDEHGSPRTASLLDYLVPGPSELPAFRTAHTVTPSPNNPLGAKGIGESGTTGAIAAVWNAVVDALAPFGVVHLDAPCTPERVWRAMRGDEPMSAPSRHRRGRRARPRAAARGMAADLRHPAARTGGSSCSGWPRRCMWTAGEAARCRCWWPVRSTTGSSRTTGTPSSATRC